ncbi:MAG: aldehyde dehydrogenase (NADP(+)) [Acidobacteriota bacterium]
MTTMPHGKHLIAGEWIAGNDTFDSTPATGDSYSFFNATPKLADQAAEAAAAAFPVYRDLSRQERAALLEAIATELEAAGDEITHHAECESGLPAARLQGELGRTTGQLRQFAQHILAGDYLERRATSALPDRQPLPRPELRLMMRPIGPVVVFGASNFPLAFSTAGGDTASALAAGCPVIVKGHPAHPATGEAVAAAILAALQATGAPLGTFGFLQDSGYEAARALVQHRRIKAVGFTGSIRAGRSLFDLCAARPEPIPFFGELGSINPNFILPGALASRGAELAAGWVGSLTLGAGQFCTNPGVVFVPEGEAADRFAEQAAQALAGVPAQTMLTDGIADTYAASAERLEAIPGVTQRFGQPTVGRSARPYLYETTAATWRSTPQLEEEVFGPLGLIVRVADDNELLEIADELSGQLTATLHLEEGDDELAGQLLPILEQKAGRVLANGFPTGVEVDGAMMHGGPYPASTNSATTSVGTLAIRRFLRPVCYQDLPDRLLPPDLRGLGGQDGGPAQA